MGENEKVEGVEIKKIIRFFNENVGGITAISTAIVAVTTTILNFTIYVFECGKLEQLKIDTSAISIIGVNTLYDFIMLVILGLLFSIVIYISIYIYKSELKCLSKFVGVITAYMIFAFLLFLFTDIYEVIKVNVLIGIIAFIIVSTIIYLCLCFFYGSILSLTTLVESKRDKKYYVIYMVVSLLIAYIFVFCAGKNAAKNRNDYKVVDNYAIIYETDEYYYLAEYDSENGKINLDSQKVVTKGDIEFNWIKIEKPFEKEEQENKGGNK